MSNAYSSATLARLGIRTGSSINPAATASLASAGLNIGGFIGRTATYYIASKVGSWAYNKLKQKMQRKHPFRTTNYKHLASRATLYRPTVNKRAAWKVLARRRRAGRTIFNAWHKWRYGQKRF